MPQPKWVVTSVTANEDYSLDLEFADGKRAVFDMSPHLGERAFMPLRNKGLFKLAHVECGTVVWNDDIDMAPEHLYECSAAYEIA